MAEHMLEIVCCWRGIFQEQMDGHFGYLGGQAQLCSFSPFLTLSQLKASLADVTSRCAPTPLLMPLLLQQPSSGAQSIRKSGAVDCGGQTGYCMLMQQQ
jgi:hypothetical protein